MFLPHTMTRPYLQISSTPNGYRTKPKCMYHTKVGSATSTLRITHNATGGRFDLRTPSDPVSPSPPWLILRVGSCALLVGVVRPPSIVTVFSGVRGINGHCGAEPNNAKVHGSVPCRARGPLHPETGLCENQRSSLGELRCQMRMMWPDAECLRM